LLAREHRLRSSDDIREVVKTGKRVSNSFATIHYLPSEINQFAVVTSKAVGNAVVRNLAKRRCRAVLFEFQNSDPAIKAVLRLRPTVATAKWEDISIGVKQLMGRAK